MLAHLGCFHSNDGPMTAEEEDEMAIALFEAPGNLHRCDLL